MNLPHKIGLMVGLVCLAITTEECSRIRTPAVLPQRSKTVVLQYDDFGPQIMSYELIGMEYYQWDIEGGDDPNAHFDIRRASAFPTLS